MTGSEGVRPHDCQPTDFAHGQNPRLFHLSAAARGKVLARGSWLQLTLGDLCVSFSSCVIDPLGRGRVNTDTWTAARPIKARRLCESE
ncbi:hypothetical protein BaRGS_00001962 [Batillaria attramentaria]|uniref:Uncharacterized protein n=1 Tax=Batillaria attramentaria TaxID=370345 RepID=A0ABD0M6Q3_9CAEN